MGNNKKNDDSLKDPGADVILLKKKMVASIIKQLKSLINGNEGESDDATLAVKIEQTDKLQVSFENLQSEVEELCPAEIEENTRIDFLSIYLEVKASLTRGLNLHRPTHSSTMRPNGAEDSQPSIVIAAPKPRLPVLHIPTFSGHYGEWPDFYSTFQAIIHNDNDITKIEKFQHLRCSLKDSALDTIRSLDISENNYDKAIQLLNERFNNKRLNFQAHIREIFSMQRVGSNSALQLRDLSDKLNSHLRALQTLGTNEQLADCLLIHLVFTKLDASSQRKWEEQTAVNELPTWQMMASFLTKRCQMMENVDNAMVTNTPGNQVGKPFSKKRVLYASAYKSNGCLLCRSNDHYLPRCSQFVKLSPALRLKEVRRLQLCINCLKRGHYLEDCTSSSCRTCMQKHHTTLHEVSTSAAATSTIEVPFQSGTSQTALVSAAGSAEHCMNENHTLLATAVVLIQNSLGAYVPCRAILDSGSQLHFITSRMVHQLNLNKRQTSVLISGIGQADLVADGTVLISMRSRVSEYKALFSAVIVPCITDNQPNFSSPRTNWNVPGNIQLADPNFNKSQHIDLLIGANLFFELLSVGQIRLKNGSTIFQKTQLGWIASGGGQQFSSKVSCLMANKSNSSTHFESNYQLDELVRSFWESESGFEPTSTATKEELDCEHHFSKTHTRLDNGEYSVRLPFKIAPSELGESYQQALFRFKNLEKRLTKQPELKEQYSAFIKEYLELRHMSHIEAIPKNRPNYFLPHHCVFKEDSSTTKLRVVFDASAVTTSGYSLNHILMAGPVIQPRLFEILLRFRSFQIAITGDICKMYRCIRVAEPDSFLQCIIWRDNPEDNCKIFKLDTVTYGTKPAAFLAIRAMQQLANDEKESYPQGSKIIYRDFYVDDLISGGNSAAEVREIMQQTSQLLQKGHFQIRKWCSNSSSILQDIPDSEREKFLEFHDGTMVTKTLGLVWDPKTDNFLFSLSSFYSEKKVTKRSILSTIARLYDPLGLIGPIITKAKIFMQLLWREGFDWDESLPQSIQYSWTRFSSELCKIDEFYFERYLLSPNATLEIHLFCDASLAAYGACVYIRATYNGQTKVNLLCSKSRVAPLKTLTVPKLELSAALLLAELAEAIHKMDIFHGKFCCWSDSTVVLSWLQSESSRFNIFVSNRISKIQTLTKNMTWSYIPTELNPADILSRGATPQELMLSTLWNHGPLFLQKAVYVRPAHPTSAQNLPEMRKKVLLSTTKYEDISLKCKYISSFEKIQRVFAYIHRFINRRKSNPTSTLGGLTTVDIEAGTLLLLRTIQIVIFQPEYSLLTSKRAIDKSSKLLNLNPFVDGDGVMRVGGRLRNSSLDFASRHPIILPKDHPLTRSITEYFHRKLLHAGPQATLASIRMRYWPLGGRKTVSHMLSKCILCFRAKPRLLTHIMGDLPKERVQISRAFTTTGIDYCGPFLYRSEVRNKAPIKCYICLFICFATKAIHLELVQDLSTDAFLAALKRFISIRGKPNVIWSDNATNFVGAKNELADLKRLFLSSNHISAVHQQCLSDHIDWKFIPPRSPHFGGLWEAAIKSAKHHLIRTIGLSILKFDEFRTLICQISAILNSRPLNPLSENPADLEVLTPAHFLIGSSFMAITEPDLTNLDISRLSRWQHINCMQQIFWKKWSSEYLTLLQQRSKWAAFTANVSIGAMVLIKDENTPPLKWPLGRIAEVIKGQDGVVRVAIIRVANGLVRRSVNKLCLLPI